MAEKDRTINYNYFHWGPFLFKTVITKEEIDQIKDLCSKEGKDYRKNLAGIIRHEHEVNRKKLFPFLAPYVESYLKAYVNYSGQSLGNQIELITSWVNYMTKFESNPIHTHDDDLSFVLFLKVPKNLKEEYNKHIGNTKPGCINFLYNLHESEETITRHSFFPEVGELYIFPASLHHFVTHFQSEGERVSVSGNFKITNAKITNG